MKIAPVTLSKLIYSEMTYSIFLNTDAACYFMIREDAFILVLTDSQIDHIVSY